MKIDTDFLLTIKNLHIEGRSGDVWCPILKGVNLTLRRGEVLGVIGESGAGKSTLGLAAMGYTKGGCRISQGSIIFDGRELVGADGEQLRQLRGVRVAYVAQSAAAAFNPAYRLMSQCIEGPVQHGTMPKAQAKADIQALFERIHLPDPETFGFRFPHQVSGGQLQRAMIAMAMSCRPDLIIFDEPTTALDVTTQIEVLSAIRDIVEQFNTAAIYITHDLAVVAQMADRIKVLRYGIEVEENETATMLSDPQEDYTKSLWAVRNFQPSPKARPTADAQPLLSLRNVTAAYGRRTVLKDLSFDVYQGRTVAVVGESGSGKSTTARCITGLLPVSAGQICYKGTVLPSRFEDRPKDLLRRIQMIHQMADTALNPRHTIGDTLGRPLDFYLGLKGKPKRDRIAELLDMVELSPAKFTNRLPSDLSGGQKQRVCIARALAAEPEMVICDEVTSALDQLVAEGILRLLDKLQRELGLTYLFITHDLATVKSIADEVIVMLQGGIVANGSKADIFAPPHHTYTETLLSSVPEMDPTWLTRLLASRAAKI